MIRAIAWDVDGTLADSEPLHHEALVLVSRRYGLMVPEIDSRFIGVAMEDVWETLKVYYPPDLTRDQWLADVVEAYIERASRVVPIAGAPEAVHALHELGLKQCCVSNSARAIVEANIAGLGLADAMSFLVAREDVVDGKPDPAPYALACVRLGLHPSEVLAVEDSAVGATSARAAGLTVLRYGTDFTDFGAVIDAAVDRRLSA